MPCLARPCVRVVVEFSEALPSFCVPSTKGLAAAVPSCACYVFVVVKKSSSLHSIDLIPSSLLGKPPSSIRSTTVDIRSTSSPLHLAPLSLCLEHILASSGMNPRCISRPVVAAVRFQPHIEPLAALSSAPPHRPPCADSIFSYAQSQRPGACPSAEIRTREIVSSLLSLRARIHSRTRSPYLFGVQQRPLNHVSVCSGLPSPVVPGPAPRRSALPGAACRHGDTRSPGGTRNALCFVGGGIPNGLALSLCFSFANTETALNNSKSAPASAASSVHFGTCVHSSTGHLLPVPVRSDGCARRSRLCPLVNPLRLHRSRRLESPGLIPAISPLLSRKRSQEPGT